MLAFQLHHVYNIFSLQLAAGIGSIERGTADADPCTASRSAGADIWRNLAVRAKRQPDQLILGADGAGQDASPLWTRPFNLAVFGV